MSVLVTGAGLVGAETARRLSERGQPCLVIDIRPPASEVLDLPGVTFAQADITDVDRLDHLIRHHRIGKIVHTAAMLSTGLRADPLRGLNVNLMGTATLLELARRHEIGRAVLISSTTILYAGFATLGPEPIPEDAALHLISERPGSLYALTKLSSEHLGLIYRDQYGVDLVALRFAAVVGGRSETPTSVPGRLFSRLIGAAGSGEHLELDDPYLVWGGQEEFVDLRDCAGAILHALDASAPSQAIYNIAHPRLWSFDEVTDAVARLHGPLSVSYSKPVTSGFAGFPHIRPAASSTIAAERELGFCCQHDLEDSLKFWWPDT